MSTPVTLLPGDANGPELCEAAQRVLDHAGVAIDWRPCPLPPVGPGPKGIPDDVIASIRATGLGFKAYHHAWHEDKSAAPPIVEIRRKLGLWANLRPSRTLAGIPSRHTDVDLVVVREITEDIYAHLEHESIPGVFESLKVTTRAACERIVRHAFTYARATGRKKVTIVHKANIMKQSDGLFLKVGREIAALFPDIASEDVIVDALCMKLVLTPSRFDVLVAGNLYGDIVSDLCAGIVGGATNAPSINHGDAATVFACPHGDKGEFLAPDRGNPILTLLPAAELARHLGHADVAERIRDAISGALGAGVRPLALGGSAGTQAFTAAVLERI